MSKFRLKQHAITNGFVIEFFDRGRWNEVCGSDGGPAISQAEASEFRSIPALQAHIQNVVKAATLPFPENVR